MTRARTTTTLLCALASAASACSAGRAPADATIPADAVDVDVGEGGTGACVRPLAVERVEDLGAFSLPSSQVLSRDGVSSGALQGRIVWTFGDTFLNRRNTIDDSSVLSATAGWSTPAAPLALDEPIDDAGLPHQLVPYTDEELRQNRADPLNGWALWPGAAIDTGDASLLVLYQRIRRIAGSGFESAGVGTARLRAGETRAERVPGDLFPRDDAGAPSLYGSGGVSVDGGWAYFFVCSEAGFLNFACRVARVPVARAGERAAFEFFDGHTWTSEMARAEPVIDHVAGGVSISRNPYLGCYLATHGQLLRSALVLRSSAALERGWGPVEQGVSVEAAAGGPILPAVAGEYDYLFLEHPALRSADGRQIVVSYARPLGNFRGEVRLARITLR